MENTDQSSVSAKPAAGGAAPAGGGGGKEKIEKQARQLAYDTRYKVRQTMSQQSGGKADPAAVRKAYMAQLGKSPAPPAVKARAKQMLLGENIVNVEELLSKNVSSVIDKVFVEGIKEEEVIEEDSKGEKTFKVRVTDKKTGNTYVRNATRDKIRELRANPNISSVEMTEYGEPTKSEKHKGGNTAAVKSGKGDEISGKDTSIDLKKEEYSSLKSENFDGFLELVEKSKEDKKGKITGEGVNNSKLVKVFPNDVKEDIELDETFGLSTGIQQGIKHGGKWAVRQGIKVGGKQGGYAVKKAGKYAGQAAKETAVEYGKGALKGAKDRARKAGELHAKNLSLPQKQQTTSEGLAAVGGPLTYKKSEKPGKFEKAGRVIGGIGGSIGGTVGGSAAAGAAGSVVPVAGTLAGGIAGGVAGGLAGDVVGTRTGGSVGKKIDKLTGGKKKPVVTETRAPINKPKSTDGLKSLAKAGADTVRGAAIVGGTALAAKKLADNKKVNEAKYDNTKSPESDKKVAKLRDKLSQRGITDKKEQDKHPQIGEAVENLDELKKRTLGSYVKKATGEVYRGSMDFGHKPLDPGADKLAKKVRKRTAGIRDATDRLDGSRDILKGRKTTTKEETQIDPVVAATVDNLDEFVGSLAGTVIGSKVLPAQLAKVGLKGALAGKVAGGALGAAAGEVLDPFKKRKDKNPVSAAVGGAAGTAAHGAIKGALQKSSYEPETNNNVKVVVEWPKWDPKGAKAKRQALQNAGGGDHTIWKPGVNIPGISNDNKVDITKGTAEGPIKDTIVKAYNFAKDPIGTISKHGKAIGKAAAPVAGGLAVGLAAKKVTDKVMGHGVKEDTDYGDDQKEVAPGTVCFDDGAALPATIKPIGDPREMSTALNLIKNKWRAKGLKMSYEPKGDHIGEDVSKQPGISTNVPKVKLKPKYKVEEGKVGAGVGGALGNIAGKTVGGMVAGPVGHEVGKYVGGALGAAAMAKKGKKGRAAAGGALGTLLPTGMGLGSGLGGAIAASHELEGEVIDEAQSSYDKARKAAARRAANRNAERRAGTRGGNMERETYTNEAGKRMHHKGYSVNENNKRELVNKGDLVTGLGGAIGGPAGAAVAGGVTGSKGRRVKKAVGSTLGAVAGKVATGGTPAGMALGSLIGGKIANSYEPEGDVVQEGEGHGVNMAALASHKEGLRGQHPDDDNKANAIRRKSIKDREERIQQSQSKRWNPKTKKLEDNKGRYPKHPDHNKEEYSAVSSALNALDSYMESSKHLHGSIIEKKN